MPKDKWGNGLGFGEEEDSDLEMSLGHIKDDEPFPPSNKMVDHDFNQFKSQQLEEQEELDSDDDMMIPGEREEMAPSFK